MVLELYNGHIRYDIAQLVTAAEGYARLWIQGFNDLAVAGCFTRRKVECSGNSRDLVLCHHIQVIVDQGLHNRCEHFFTF